MFPEPLSTFGAEQEYQSRLDPAYPCFCGLEHDLCPMGLVGQLLNLGAPSNSTKFSPSRNLGSPECWEAGGINWEQAHQYIFT